MLSFLAYDNFNTPVKGIQTLVPEYEAKYGTNLPDNPLREACRSEDWITCHPLPPRSPTGASAA